MSRSLVCTDFETDRSEATLEYLKRYLDNARAGITQESYIRMEEAFGNVVDLSKMPPCYEDFPDYVHIGLEIFNSLTDTFTGGMTSIYSGKNYSSLEVFMNIYDVEKADRLKVLEVIKYLDSRARETALKDAKKAASKAKKG